MLYITVPDMNDSVSSVTIADKEYLIRFTYNGTGDFWSYGISDTDENPIISPTKIVPNFPLTHFMNFTSYFNFIDEICSDCTKATSPFYSLLVSFLFGIFSLKNLPFCFLT